MDTVFLQQQNKPAGKADEPEGVSVHDTSAVASVLGRLSARAEAVFGSASEEESEDGNP